MAMLQRGSAHDDNDDGSGDGNDDGCPFGT